MMKDSLGANAAQPVSMEPITIGTGNMRAQGLLRRIILIVTSTAAVLVCCLHMAVANANTEHAAGLGYLCLSLVLFGCSAGFWTRSRSAQGTLKLRWILIAAAALTASIGYLPSFTQFIFHTAAQRQLQTACFNASEALYLLAAVVFFSRVPRSIVIVDMVQVLLFLVLRFNLIYSATTPDHFTSNHLLIGQLVALCLFLVAMVACLGAASRGELKFLRTLACFFGLRLITFFLANQVSYTWLHRENSSEWDVPGTVLLAGFVLYLLYTSRKTQQEAHVLELTHAPSVVVRSLMPSFLALVDVMLGLILLHNLLLLAAIAIAVALLAYITRAALLDVQATKERARLERRNQHLEGLTICDPLTGIGNRRALAGAYNRLQSTAGDAPLSLLLIDIDYFKQANDCHGHLHGDKVLITLARALEGLAASLAGSHCARFGGDEFALLLVGLSEEEVRKLAEELRSMLRAHVWEAEDAGVSLSIGVASVRQAQDLPLEAMVSYADKALYRAKLLGRNRVEVQPIWEPGTAAEDLAAGTLRLELQHSAG
jgi:diguanylate cyclase (GGDEF)-like protein